MQQTPGCKHDRVAIATLNAVRLQDRRSSRNPVNELRPVEGVHLVNDGRSCSVKTGRSVEHRCEGERREWSPLATEEPEQQAQRDTNDDRCHDGDVNLNISSLDHDVTGPLTESKLFRQQPCRTNGNEDDSDEDQRLCHLSLTTTHMFSLARPS